MRWGSDNYNSVGRPPHHYRRCPRRHLEWLSHRLHTTDNTRSVYRAGLPRRSGHPRQRADEELLRTERRELLHARILTDSRRINIGTSIAAIAASAATAAAAAAPGAAVAADAPASAGEASAAIAVAPREAHAIP